MEAINIDYTGVLNVIENLKRSSSSGDNVINSKILKNTSEISSRYLTDIFQRSLNTCNIPLDWKIARVIPIHKSGDRNSAANYRPISLTSIPSKILEQIIFTNVIRHLESNNLLNVNQHRFRKNLSYETQLLEFIHHINMNTERKTQTDAIFLDFSKAFNRVPHSRLITKLSIFNIHPLIVN